jgi:hypothetical protein
MTKTAALALIAIATVATAYASDRCSILVPPGGLYDHIRKYDDSKLQVLIDEYVSHKEYKTHDEAIADGFSVGTIIYGVPVQAGNTYTQTQRDQWKLDYQSRKKLNYNQEEQHSLESATLNVAAIQEIAHCIVKTTQAHTGVNADLYQVDDCTFRFSAWYVPNSFFDLPPRFKELLVSGGECDRADHWYVTYGGWLVQCHRHERNPFSVAMNTSAGTGGADGFGPIPDPGAEPGRPEYENQYFPADPNGREYVTSCSYTRPEVGAGKGVCSAPGPIYKAQYACNGEYCGYSYAVGPTLPGDGYDSNCNTCVKDGPNLRWARAINSSAPGTATYTVWYTMPRQVCVRNCDYDAQHRAWEERNKRTCVSQQKSATAK